MRAATAEFEAEVAASLDYLAIQRRASAHTLNNYHRELQRLVALCEGTGANGVDSALVRRLAGRLHCAGLAPRSVARALSAWRGFFRWRVRHGGAAHNPVAGVRAPRAPRSLPKNLGPDAMAALLDVQGADPLEIRDHAIFELLYSAGLRLAELLALDVDAQGALQSGEITVTGKRAKTRMVPVGPQAARAVGAWMAQRGLYARAAEPALFISRSGTRLSQSAVRSRLARWARLYGDGTHLHPHMMRHSFASHVLQSSGDLRAVQEMLGHASVQSTQIYTQLDFQHLAKVYDAAHPRARKRS